MSEEETKTAGAGDREARIGRIVDDFLQRRSRGETVREADLLAEHPDLADELRGHLELLRDLRPGGDKIEDLVAQGMLAHSADQKYPAELGPYKILDFLGRGGMGIVLKAYEESLNRTVTLKILRPELAADTTALSRFEREAKAAAALRHPNIVTVYAVGRERGMPFLTMEYIDGPTLASVIREGGPLDAGTVRRCSRQLLEALACAHKSGLVHRDVKSGNVLLDGPEGRVKLADFGLARIMTAQTRMTLPASVLGTPEYMSPEQARGSADIDHRTDLYSAGVVLYEMLTGRTPFRADTPTAVIHRILHDELTDPRKLVKSADPRLSRLALRLMAKRPEDRLPTAAAALAALQGGRRIKVRSVYRRRLLRWAVGVCGAIALAAAAWLWMGSIDHQAAVVQDAADIAISQVRVSPDTGNVVQVQYGASTKWTKFHQFPENVAVTGAVPVDVDGSGRRFVAIATDPPVRDSGFSLFNCDKSEVWELNLTSDLPWPDCNPTVGWACTAVTAGDLDGKPGDEIAVVASDVFEYPTRLSILEPQARTILATFWHLGDIGAQSGKYKSLWIEADFFGPGLPAIIVQGMNNKLDGFYKPQPDDPPPLTKHPIVSFMAVLDPRKMLEEKEGLVGLRPARGFRFGRLGRSTLTPS